MFTPHPSWLASAVILSTGLAVSAQSSGASDLQTLYQRRIPFIVGTYPIVDPLTTLEGLLKNETATGQWPDVDYTAGCPARRANWPAQNHWLHTLSLAAAYVDALPHTGNFTQEPPHDFVGNATVKSALDLAMNYWFTNDFTEPACLDQGGLTNNTCPCGTAGLWNTNWFSNLILIPRQALQTCVLLNNTITPAQRQSCINMGLRGYGAIDRFIYGLGYITGANTLDVSSNTINVGILEAFGGNVTAGEALINEAYRRVHNEVQIQTALKADGIRPDGSFGQHLGILYNGNYGKDYTNLVLSLETSAAGTQWQANATGRAAFSSHIEGSAWMVYRNTVTGVSHWDFSTVGRFISFPTPDLQATAALNINLTSVRALGALWNDTTMQETATKLLQNGTTANAGNLVGNRMFYDNDYMVQRGKKYVTTVKMISPRSANTECVNLQNPFGFHLGQGAVFNYYVGNEYEDIAAAWDWNLIPGITTNYAATPLSCNFTQWSGNRTFVGGASDGRIGVAAMDYLNPYTGAFAYKKSWFFFDQDVQHVIVSGVSETTTGADVYSVLDQKRANGPVYVNGAAVTGAGGNYTTPKSLWHSGIGYTFDSALPGNGIDHLSVAVASRTGNWTTIGTSIVPPTTVNLFSAWLQHNPATLASSSVSYSVYPDTKTPAAFAIKSKLRPIQTIASSADVSAAVDVKNRVLSAVFWNPAGGSVTVPGRGTVKTDHGAIVIVSGKTGTLTVSDPTQSLTTLKITLQLTAPLNLGRCSKVHGTKTLNVALPQGANVGKSVTISIC